MALPKFLQSSLWSYDIKKMDVKADKDLIIQQVLNYGTEKQLKWLFETYSEKEIKEVLRHPRRGCWYADVLNYWFNIFDLKIDKDSYELAIREINPSPERQKLIQKLLARKLKIRI